MKRFLCFAFACVFMLASCLSFGACSKRPDEIIEVNTNSQTVAAATPEITEELTAEPTAEATPVPPTEEPTEIPTEEPTEAPTPEPTPAPTAAPTQPPTAQPTEDFGGKYNGRRVYLTFDDGPTLNTARTLDILNSYGIKATFFTVGMFVDYHPNIAKRIVNEGHLLGSHTYSHDFNVIYQSPYAFIQDVAKWRNAVIKAVGWDAGAYYLRFPGGTTNTTIGGREGRGQYVAAVHAAGYKIYDWTLGLNDKWLAGNTDNLPVSDYLWKTYRDTLRFYANSDKPLVFLIHDDVDESLELLPRIIEDLMSLGCTFGTVNEINDYLA